MHTLPPILAEMVTATTEAIGCDPALAALPALAVVASAIGNSRAVLLKRGWIEPAVVWAITVAESGGHKSPAYSAVVDPLVSLQMDLYDAHKERIEEHRLAMEEYQATPKDERGKKPDPPAEPETFQTSDATIEALGVLLEQRPKGLLVARDELDAWFSSFARYRGNGGGTDRPQWLELHRAGTLRIDRLTREKQRVAVRRAAVSLTGTIQPAVLARALDEEALQSGLGARFLLAMPPRRKRVWTEAELSEELANRYRSLLMALLALPLADDKKRKPHVLGLSVPAQQRWVRFYNESAQEQFNAEGEQAACFAKIEAYAPRLMLLHHVVSHVGTDVDDRTAITEASVLAGIELARWFAAEAVRVYYTLSESKEERKTRRLIEHLQSRGGTISARDLQKSNSSKYPTSEQANAALDELAGAGFGHWNEPASSPRGGHPARRFSLGPTLDTTDTTDGEGEDDPVEGPPTSSDTTADTTPPAPCFPGVFVGSVGSVNCRAEAMPPTLAPETQEPVAAGSVGLGPVVSDSAGYMLVTDSVGLEMVRVALDNSTIVGIDTETTGLDHRTDRVRLLSLACETIDNTSFVYIVDCFAVDPAPLWETLADKELVLHNAVFDLSFLERLGFAPTGRVHDTMLTSRVLYAGTREPHGLTDCVRRELSRELDKEMQRSDWAGTLTQEQLDYAARDATVLRPLFDTLMAKITEAKLERTAEIEAHCLPAVVRMGTQGVAVDRDAWIVLARAAGIAANRLRDQMTTASTQEVRESCSRDGTSIVRPTSSVSSLLSESKPTKPTIPHWPGSITPSLA